MTAAMHDVYIKNLRNSDIFLASFPKSGNTWMRFLLANIVSLIELDGIEIDYHMLNGPFVAELDSGKFGDLKYYCIPRFVKTHEEYERTIFGPYKSVYVLRNPGDVMVSYYEYQRGLKEGRGIPQNMGISEFIRDRNLGIDSWCRHVRSWSNACTVCITYEDLKLDPFHTVQGLLHVLNIPPIPDSILYEAIQRSDFSSVRKMEESKGLDTNASSFLRADYRFARKGTVGQWLDRLSDEDVQFINEWLARYDLKKYGLRTDNARLGVTESVALDHVARLSERGEWSKIIQIINGISQNSRLSNLSLIAEAMVYYHAGYSDMALEPLGKIVKTNFLFEKAADLKKMITDSSVKTEKIRKLISDHEVDKAAQLFDEDVSVVQENVDLWYLRSVCLKRKGIIREVSLELESLLKIYPYYGPAKELLLSISKQYDLGNPRVSIGSDSDNKLPVSPLTGSDRVVKVRSIASKKILEQYKDQLNIDVSRFLNRNENVHLYKCLDTGYRFYFPYQIGGDAKFYDDIAAIAPDMADFEFEAGVLRDLIKQGHRVFEIGPCKADLIEDLRESGIDVTSLGFEDDPAIHQETYAAINQKLVDDQAVKYEHRFDEVLCFHMLEQIPNPVSFLRSLIRLLKPGGRLFLSSVNHSSAIGLDRNNILDMPPYSLGHWNEKSMQSLQYILDIRLVNLLFEPMTDKQPLINRIVHENIPDQLGVNDPLIQLLTSNSNKIKGIMMMAVFEKPGGKA